MEVEFVPANKLLAREGSTPAEVVVVRQGSIRVSGENLPGGSSAPPAADSHAGWRCSGPLPWT
jgi:hypothetical protein